MNIGQAARASGVSVVSHHGWLPQRPTALAGAAEISSSASAARSVLLPMVRILP